MYSESINERKNFTKQFFNKLLIVTQIIYINVIMFFENNKSKKVKHMNYRIYHLFIKQTFGQLTLP
jgi:hypothetical protein